jgi:hypothetical protein
MKYIFWHWTQSVGCIKKDMPTDNPLPPTTWSAILILSLTVTEWELVVVEIMIYAMGLYSR